MAEEEILVITSDDISEDEVKDPYTIYEETKGKPLWEEPLTLDGVNISIINYNAEFDFTDIHRQELTATLLKMHEINPTLAERFKRLVFTDTQPGSRYSDEEKFPINGRARESDGTVYIFKRGQRTDIPHRIHEVSNFQGTIAHEVFHFGNAEYEEPWKKSFGWHYCSEDPNTWERLSEDTYQYKNRLTGFIAENGIYTDAPKSCITDYGTLDWDDDYADSGVATLFATERLSTISPEKVSAIENPKRFCGPTGN